MKSKGKDIRVVNVDIETGEILNGVPVWVGPKIKSPYGSRWYMSSQDAALMLATNQSLGAECYRVFFYLVSRLDFENYIQLPQKDICEALGMKKQNVSRAVLTLEKEEVIIRGPKVGLSCSFRLNHQYGWKGKARNLKLIVDNEIEKTIKK